MSIMIFEEKKYEEQEYEGLVNLLLQCENIDEELQHARRYTLRSNPKMFFFLFRAVATLKEIAKHSNEDSQISGLQNLDDKLNELELRLSENTNIIPADLPDSILYDKNLSSNYLADHSTIIFKQDDWRSFQNYIEEKAQSIPKDLELPFLAWCEKMLKLNFERHMKVCKNPTSCPQNQGYDRRIQYISRLIGDITPPQTAPIFQVTVDTPPKLSDKIQWLGTQKELAELFIRLRAKGWITDFEPETIKDCFTNSNSIQQYLKPGEYTEDLGGTFEQVLTVEYAPKFHGILPNPKRN